MHCILFEHSSRCHSVLVHELAYAMCVIGAFFAAPVLVRNNKEHKNETYDIVPTMEVAQAS